MAKLPGGYVLAYGNEYPPDRISYLVGDFRLKDGADREALLSDLSFTVGSYKNESLADKTRHAGILCALKELDTGLPHTLAALTWVKIHGGKKQDPHKARIAYRKHVCSRPQEYAKANLAFSLARILETYTIEKVNTSRYNGVSDTDDGVLATLFQNVLKLVDGKPMSDPFPYLIFATTPR